MVGCLLGLLCWVQPAHSDNRPNDPEFYAQWNLQSRFPAALRVAESWDPQWRWIANNGGNVEVWIRGVGSSNNTELGDPAAATHFDGVYIPRPAGIGSAFFDIQRVEVNVGPQGTLRGRNATAGSVNIISWKPGLGVWDAEIEGEYGNYNQTVIRGMLNVPIGDRVAIRASGTISRSLAAARSMDSTRLWM